MGRETGLIIPFWLADRRSDGLEQGENGKKACFGDLKFPAKPVENLLFSLHRSSVGDYLPLKGPDPQNSTNSGKNSTNVLGYPRSVACLAIGGVFAAENHR